MTKREKVIKAALLMNMATAEVENGVQDAIAEYTRGKWRATRPSSTSLSLETRWRSAQLAAMALGKGTLCFPCWKAQLEIWRHGGADSARDDVATQCCGMINCLGPLSEMSG